MKDSTKGSLDAAQTEVRHDFAGYVSGSAMSPYDLAKFPSGTFIGCA